MKYIFDMMDRDGIENGFREMLRKAIRNAAYYNGDPEQGGVRITRNESPVFIEIIKAMEEATGLPYVPTDDLEQMKVVREQLYKKQLKETSERIKWTSGKELDSKFVAEFREIWLDEEKKNIDRWKTQTPEDRPEITIELNEYAKHISILIEAANERKEYGIFSHCTAEAFKADLTELCPECPLRDEIIRNTDGQIAFQARQQQEILSKDQFEVYCSAEIKDAQQIMMKMSTLVQLDNDNPAFRTARIFRFIRNKERIKTLNLLRSKIVKKQADKPQNFLDEITKIEQKVQNNGNDQFIQGLLAPNLYIPVATLWESFGNEGSSETIKLFREKVQEYVEYSKLVVDKLVNDYEKERKKQPERKAQLLVENRDWYIKRLADVYVPIDAWYHDFWVEQTQSVGDVDALESKIFLFCYHVNKPFIIGLRLLRDLFGYYRAIDKFNELIQQKELYQPTHTTPSDNNEQVKTKKHVRICLIKYFENKPISGTSAPEIAIDYDLPGKYAWKPLLKLYDERFGNETTIKTYRGIRNHIEAVLSSLSDDARKKAEKMLKEIDNKRH